MAMYTISTIPLIMKLEDEAQIQVWCADAAAAGGSLSSLRRWWDNLPGYLLVPKSWGFSHCYQIMASCEVRVFQTCSSYIV